MINGPLSKLSNVMSALQAPAAMHNLGSKEACRFEVVLLSAGEAADPHQEDLWKTSASNPLVKALPDLGWCPLPGSNPPQVSCPNAAVQSVLLPGCRRSGSAESKEEFGRSDVLVANLSPEVAGDITFDLGQWGLLSRTWPQASGFLGNLAEYLKDMPDGRMNSLMLDENSLEDSEEFVGPTGRAGRGATASADGPAEMQWLTMCPWSILYRPNDALPFLQLARLKALLGSTMRRVTRAEETSNCRTSVQLLTGWCCAFSAQPAAPLQPGVLIRALPLFLQQCHLPSIIQSPFFSTEEVLDDFIDGQRWAFDPASRFAIEFKRLCWIPLSSPHTKDVLGRFKSWDDARLHYPEFLNKVLPKQSGRPLFAAYAEGETFLAQRHHLIAQLLQPQVDSTSGLPHDLSGKELLDALAADFDSTRVSGGGGSSTPAGNDASDDAGAAKQDSSASGTLREVEISKCVNEGSFRAAVARSSGKTGVDLLEELFMAKSTLMARFLMQAPAWLRERVPIFGTASMWQHERQSYFAKALAVDPLTGQVPTTLQLYAWDAKQCQLWLLFRLREMNVVDAEEGGFLKIDSLSQAARFHRVKRFHQYTVESVLRRACAFFHRLFVSIGTPSEVPANQGFTMVTLGDFLCNYLQMANALPPAEKAEWIQFGYDAFMEDALGKIEELMLSRLGSSRPSDREASIANNPILEFDCTFKAKLDSKMAHASSLVLMRNSFPTMFNPSKVDILAPPPKPVSGAGGGTGAGSSALVHLELSEGDEDFSDDGSAKDLRSKIKGKGKKKKEKRPSETNKEKEKARKKAKRQKTSQEKAKAKAASDVPGGKTHLTKRLSDKLLFIAGFTFDTHQIAKDFKVDHNSKCWQVLLSKKAGPAALALCPQHTKHGDMTQAVHCPPPSWKLDEVHAKYGKRATKKQADEAGWVSPLNK